MTRWLARALGAMASDRALGAQLRDVVLRVAEARQHFVSVLTQARRRSLDARTILRELERGQRNGHRSLDAIDRLVPVQDLARLELRVAQRLREAPHAAGRHVATLEILLPLVGGTLRDDLL